MIVVRLLVPDKASRDHLLRRVHGANVGIWEPQTGVTPRDADMLFLTRPRDPAVLTSLSAIASLRLVQLVNLGYEWLLPHVPTGVKVSNGKGTCESSVAEQALHLLLASMKNARRSFDQQSSQQWLPFETDSVEGRSILIFGYGGVGRTIARYLRPLGPASLQFVASRKRPIGPGPVVHGADKVPDLLRRNDVLIFALPSTSSTRHLVDAAFLAQLRRGTHLVNVGRGDLIDTDALLAALRTKGLYAALDVVGEEPLPSGHPLWTAPNVVLSPHVGGNTALNRERGFDLVAQQYLRLASGQPLKNLVYPSQAWNAFR
jgi:phosphoglycerate dehydrogenase-like enzyme